MSEVKKMCPACNVEMELMKKSYPLGNIHINERYHVDIYECPKCRRVDFFASEEEETVVCPVCGTPHNVHEKCAICAMNKAYGNLAKV